MNIYCSSKSPYLYNYRNKNLILICDSYIFLSSYFNTCKLSEVTELYYYLEKFEGLSIKLDLRYTNVRQIRFRAGPALGSFRSTLRKAIITRKNSS